MTIHSRHQNTGVSTFVVAAAQLSHPTPFGRLAGVSALASVADQWPARRQQCIDLLCAYLRTPVSVPVDREEDRVREAILDTIAARLRRPTRPAWARRLPVRAPWEGVALNFTGARLPRVDFTGCRFAGPVAFVGASFDADALFCDAVFDAPAEFLGAEFNVNTQFDGATFNDAATFANTTFHGSSSFEQTTFNGPVSFPWAPFGPAETEECAPFPGSTTIPVTTPHTHAAH